MSRSPLFASFRRALLRASLGEDGPATARRSADAGLRRRDVLRGAAALAAGVAAEMSGLGRAAAATPRVAIVGAGLAGLACAWRLKQAGVQATVYEASNRVGGRMYTASGALAPGVTTELGGEFINTDHADVLALAQEFQLPLYDRSEASEKALRDGLYFDGRLIEEAELADALRPYAARFAADAERLERDFDTAGPALDALSFSAYLDRLGMRGWLRSLTEVVAVTEFGLAPEEQTCLNLLWLLPTVSERHAALLGASDERFKVVGGNQRIPEALAQALPGQIRTGMPLAGLRQRESGTFTLFFPRDEAVADIVVLAIPFSVLRQIPVEVQMPATLRRFIREVGYGDNAKVMAGFQSRPWRSAGWSGGFHSDLPFQTCWDSSQMQPGDAGAVTWFVGGETGRRIVEGPAEDWARSFAADLDRVLPGAAGQRNGTAARFSWSTSGWSRGSYVCYRPGQYSGFAHRHTYIEEEGERQDAVAGRLVFAGEHVSDAFQGYMNGAAQTGRLAAHAVLRMA